MNDSGFRLRDIYKSFVMGGERLDILRGVSLDVNQGELVALLGPSGAGKSTLLHIAGLLETADAGEIYLNGSACHALADGAKTLVRRKSIGFVYQFHNLLPEFTAQDNVALACMINGVPKEAARNKALDLLAKLGLSARSEHLPSQLSGGEQQRVAIARALANQPTLLLADEPTGNLDERTAAMVFDELLAIARAEGVCALIATHNTGLADSMDRRILLHNGVIE